jgi:hypothetical protein
VLQLSTQIAVKQANVTEHTGRLQAPTLNGHLGHSDAAAAIMRAIESVLLDSPRTRDIGGTVSTQEVGRGERCFVLVPARALRVAVEGEIVQRAPARDRIDAHRQRRRVPTASVTVNAHVSVACGATVSTCCAIEPAATPVHPLSVYGAVPPPIVTCCAGAAGDVKLTDVGASVTTGGPPLTVIATIAVRLGFDASAIVSTQPPAPSGAMGKLGRDPFLFPAKLAGKLANSV